METKEGIQSVEQGNVLLEQGNVLLEQGNVPLGLNVWFDGYFTTSENNP
jgi:hypothetical protein